MLYEVYSLGNSLYGKIANHNRLVILSKEYKTVDIIYLSTNKETNSFVDVNIKVIEKHIKKYLNKLQEKLVK